MVRMRNYTHKLLWPLLVHQMFVAMCNVNAILLYRCCSRGKKRRNVLCLWFFIYLWKFIVNTELVVLLCFYLAETPGKFKKKSTDSSTKDDNGKQDQFSCPHSEAVFSAAKNCHRHIRETHNLDTSLMLCVDLINGIYVTPKYDHSPVFPIHVMKSTNSTKIACELHNCRCFMQIAWSSGNLGKECVHCEQNTPSHMQNPHH